MSDSARRELLLHGAAGSATVLGVRQSTSGGTESECVFTVQVQLDGARPYDTRVRQRVRVADLEGMQPGDVVCCRVDPGDPDRLVLYVPDSGDATTVSVSKILANGRRADGTVLATAPVAADYAGREDPVLRLDLELRAWDEPKPWHVRLIQPVPLTAIGLVDLGQHLEVAFFTVDHGETVAVDWAASLGEE
ncbi:hypothetical protein [Nocardia sp. XZ_19_385]|uniref:hypothetical protein n=1 Tax=Nocardia sp. XZ_19_385 TaxID=2769488 RepID=UPI001E2FF55F|nr:hypothetical protein [Nocardia sp. XZ_19_385]